MKGQKKKCKDHLGNEYNSIAKMCEVYGINKSTYYNRLDRGWSFEDALTTPLNNKNPRSAKKYKDHLGNEYDSITEMCKAYNIYRRTFDYRLNHGCTLDEALTLSRLTSNNQNKGKKKNCKDHLGNEYDSISEMCKAYGVKETTYCKRLERGFTLDEALTRDVKTSRGRHYKKCKDHLGNEYDSISEMCDAYGIKYDTYRIRIKRGLTIKDALTNPISVGGRPPKVDSF